LIDHQNTSFFLKKYFTLEYYVKFNSTTLLLIYALRLVNPVFVATHKHKHEADLVEISNAKMPKGFSLWHFCDNQCSIKKLLLEQAYKLLVVSLLT